MITVIKQNDAVTEYLERDKYVNLNAIEFLRNSSDADVFLYNEDIENGLIIGEQARDFFYLATVDPGFMHEFWQSLDAGHKCFSGVPKPMALVFQKDKDVLWQSPCKVYTLKGAHEPVEGVIYKNESLVLADAEEVDKYYTYKSDHSLDYIRENITMRDSSCIRIDGRLASWCAVHQEDNSMGPLYTKEEYRGKGLAAVVASRLIEKLVAKNVIPFVQIVESNDVSLHLAERLNGMEYTHDCIWFGIEKN